MQYRHDRWGPGRPNWPECFREGPYLGNSSAGKSLSEVKLSSSLLLQRRELAPGLVDLVIDGKSEDHGVSPLHLHP